MTLTPEQEHVERVRELARHLAADRPTVRLGAAPLSVRERYAEPLDALLSEITELRERLARIFVILNDPKRSHIYARIGAKAVAAEYRSLTRALAPFDEEGT